MQAMSSHDLSESFDLWLRIRKSPGFGDRFSLVKDVPAFDNSIGEPNPWDSYPNHYKYHTNNWDDHPDTYKHESNDPK